MAFTNNTPLRSREEMEALKEQRKKAMFANGKNAQTSIFPLNEKVNVPLDLIDLNPDNEKIFNMDMVEELSDDMNDEGFRGAIELFTKPDGRFEISAGHRRYLAQKLRGETHIPAIITERPSEPEVAKRLLSSNVHNRNLTALDMANAIEYYINQCLVPTGFKGDKIKECSRFFHKSESSIKRFMAISRMIPELQALAGDPAFPYSAFSNARTFTEEQQLTLYKQILEYQKRNPGIEVSRLHIEQTIGAIKRSSEKKHLDINTTYGLNESSIDNHTLEPSSIPVIDSAPEEKRSSDNVELKTTEFREATILEVEDEQSGNDFSRIIPLEPVLKNIYKDIESISIEFFSINNKEQCLSIIKDMQHGLESLESLVSKI